jgi:AraC family transcriptional regulator of adaptative response/methylated-DNA-[protein]-cysteine methyltransferase
MILLEAMSPAESARRGEGLDIVCGLARSPFGWLLSVESARGLCHLSFVEASTRTAALALVAAQWPAAHLHWQPAASESLVAQLWNGAPGPNEPRRLWVRATPFQLGVWRALLTLKRGEQVSYAQLAAQVKAPAAARAVGGAVAANPIAWLIPCHRVIRADGALGGYRWGTERKRAMLAWERHILESQRDTDGHS